MPHGMYVNVRVRHRTCTDCHRPPWPTQQESSVPAQLTHSPPHPGDVTTKKGAPRLTVGTNVCQLGKRVEFRWEQGQTPSGGGGGGDGAASASAAGKAVRQSSPPLCAPPVSGEAHISCCVSGLTTHWRCASGTGPVGWAGGAAQSNIVAALPMRNATLFSSFPYVCPDPVLVKRCISYLNGAKSGISDLPPRASGPGPTTRPGTRRGPRWPPGGWSQMTRCRAS